MTELLGRTKPDKLQWTDKCQQAFDELKNALMNKPVLHPPNFAKPFLLVSDSSKISLSAILMQSGDDDTKANHVIAYASRKLLGREQRYPVIELELLALVFGLQKFRHIIYQNETRVYTDHRPLSWLNSLVKHSPRLARWALLIQDYNVTTTYIRGKIMSLITLPD